MEIKRVSRQCYDKPHRCPGWAGGGWKYTPESICDSSYVDWYGHQEADGTWVDKRFKKWRLNVCRDKCGTLVLPYATRYVDPTWYWWTARDWPNDFTYWTKAQAWKLKNRSES